MKHLKYVLTGMLILITMLLFLTGIIWLMIHATEYFLAFVFGAGGYATCYALGWAYHYVRGYKLL